MVEIKSCGAIIYYEDNPRLYLIVYKKDKDYWGYPKGTPEGNETEEQTSLREIKEEVGLDVELINGYRKQISYFAGKDLRSTMILFLAKSEKKEVYIEQEEISEYKWLSYDKAIKLLSHKTSKKALEEAEIFLGKQ